MRRPTPARLLFVVALLCLFSELPAQTVGPGKTVGGWIDRTQAEDLEPIETEARSSRSSARAESLYKEILRRHTDSDAGVRAALWLGRYHYGRGRELDALPFFEAALRNGKDAERVAEARFWCDQARQLIGRDLLSEGERGIPGSFWATMGELPRIDLALHQGWRQEVESGLLSLEGDLRQNGLRGLEVARWADLLSLPGEGRVAWGNLEPLLRDTRFLPEQARSPAQASGSPSTLPSWTLQFGTYLYRGNAARLVDDLSRIGLDVRVDESLEQGQDLYRVHVGDKTRRAEIDSLASAVAQAVTVPFRVVRMR